MMNTLPLKTEAIGSVEQMRGPGSCVNSNKAPAHPIMALDQSLKNGSALDQELDTFYKPIKTQIMMELKSVGQVGRLGGLESSRLHMDLILGTDEDIGPEDYLKLENEAMVDVPLRYIEAVNPDKQK